MPKLIEEIIDMNVEDGLYGTLKSLIDKLFEAARQHSLSGDVDYDEETIISLERLLDVRKYWNVIVKDIPYSNLDRAGSMFGGFPFTSKSFPWPMNEKINL